MILERLLDFHDTQDMIIPAVLKAQRVRWMLDLDEDGRFLGISETGTKKSDQKELVAPYTGRTVAVVPFLFVDKPDYVLGHVVEGDNLSDPTLQKELVKARDRHAAYAALSEDCAQAIDHPALTAFLSFLKNEIEKARSEVVPPRQIADEEGRSHCSTRGTSGAL